MSYFFLIVIFVHKIIALWRAFQMFWYHTSPTLSLTLQLKPWKYCSPSNNIFFRCSYVVQVKGVTRPVGFDAQVCVDTNLCSVGCKNVTLNIFPSIPVRFWSPGQAWCWTVMSTHQLVNYIWMSCSQGLMRYRLTHRKKMAVMSLNSCLPSGGCQLKPISYAYISQMLSVDETAEWIAACNFGSSFWMCGVNSFHWYETTPILSATPTGIFVQTRWSFNSASFPLLLAPPLLGPPVWKHQWWRELAQDFQFYMDMSPLDIVVFPSLYVFLKECAGWSSWNYTLMFSEFNLFCIRTYCLTCAVHCGNWVIVGIISSVALEKNQHFMWVLWTVCFENFENWGLNLVRKPWIG